MTKDLPTLLAEAEAHDEAMSPGEWKPAEWANYEEGGWAAIGPHHKDEYGEDEPDTPCHDKAKADAAGIAFMRNNLGALVREARALLAENQRLKERIERQASWLSWPGHARAAKAERERDAAIAENERLRGLLGNSMRVLAVVATMEPDDRIGHEKIDGQYAQAFAILLAARITAALAAPTEDK